MPIFSKNDLQKLMNVQADRCLSIYMPTQVAGPETRQNPIRFKNQLSRAEQLLMQEGLSEEETAEFLKPIVRLEEDYAFWQHQGQGLALFLAAGQTLTYQLPIAVESLVTVTPQPQVKPLLPLLTDDGQFYVLAASQNQVRLFQATHYSIQAVDLGDTPASLETALKYDDPEDQLQSHSGSGGGSQAIFHGQGVGTNEDKTNVLRFFHKVDHGVQNILQGQTAPLVFIGVDFLFPVYQEANTYPHLLDEAVATNPDNLSAEELRDRAWSLIEPHFHQAQETALTQYGNLQSADQSTDELAEIVAAAHTGQVDTLLLAPQTQRWGHYDAQSRQLEQHDQQTADSEDLLNLAAMQTLLNGGRVLMVERDRMPNGGDIAATLRYPVIDSLVNA
ncbi:hypothetical protein IQ241_17195 [Romeria aff. gracilis LEGE 07310]|uniref:Uncharacterized protein n=1 Tax=Vasconcelosia minhoensis LEGE 07310 TaxID=915328 RepID=A0A8J7DML4_9CYAN|nr:hypothetical protein [Romeria gracilis]MBE9079011.1 hypothetical protein [Romeria aff. gracilis LEGE 07310]